MRYAEVAVEKTTFAFDALFTYEIPEGLDIRAGMRVVIPFGKGNRHRIGVVFRVTEKSPGGRINGSYRARIIVKCKNNKAFRSVLRSLMHEALKDRIFRDVSLYADFNGEI